MVALIVQQQVSMRKRDHMSLLETAISLTSLLLHVSTTFIYVHKVDYLLMNYEFIRCGLNMNTDKSVSITTIIHLKGAGGVSICPIMEMGFIVFFERGE